MTGSQSTISPWQSALSIRICSIFMGLMMVVFSHLIQAQDTKISIELGDKNLPINKPFTITVTIQNSEKRDATGFPNIPGFQKRGVESVTTSSVVGGKTTLNHRIIQNYAATKEGVYRIAQFSMMVNGQPVRSEGGTVNVIPPNLNDTNDSKVENESEGDITASDEAFLALRVNTSRVFVGQGFTVKLAFYVAETNTAEMDFPNDLGAQVSAIAHLLQPSNCLIENFGIEEVQTLPVLIGNKKYTEYKLYQAVLYPLNSKPIRFPEIGLNMLVKQEGKSVTKLFKAKSFPVVPMELPNFAAKNQAVVGAFQVIEKISSNKVVTGKSFQYEVRVIGEGNLSAIPTPTIEQDTLFDFYPPDVRQLISRRLGRVTGEKIFTFQVIPKQAGTFALGNYVRWVRFDPATARYDTLKANLAVTVSGKSIKNDSEASEGNSIFANLEKEDSTKQEIDWRALVKGIANLFLAVMLLGMVAIFWTKKEKK
ncbi:MAG: BatD family protein [Spirosomataceae bacterium]